jgi:hypothetical protein
MDQVEVSYKFKGLPLTPAVAEHVISSQLIGRQLKRAEIVNCVEQFHASNGGFPCQANDLSRTVKKALDNMKANGVAENPSTGWWRILSGIDGDRDQSIQALDESAIIGDNGESETQAIQPLMVLGDGDESVYLYYYPAYKANALANGDDKWLCKIGRTDSNANIRISSQSTGMPEKPEIGLVYRTSDSRTLESVLHGILSLRNQWSESSPGVEWFNTSIEDVLEIIGFVVGHPGTGEQNA